ncbi:GH25 family lysozyme [Weissella muntiaci]|nr:GH25 family lysozyme [Weissella muntiaci]
MNKLKTLVVAIASAFFVFGGMTVVSQSAHADTPRYDMIDVSNHNGAMSADEFRYMRDNYGVKAVTTKISEGTTFSDWTAAGNIKAAIDAGLYVNGYSYIHATTVAGAIAEADYAASVAQQAGLPVGAVLAVDVENADQMAMGRAMQPVVQAFMNEVQRVGGYRSTTYTMGSHLEVSVDGDPSWIASYPYTPTSEQSWYSTEHAWQWTSKATFASSLGVFDVSQLYDDFFTAGQDASNNVTPPVEDDNTTDTVSLNGVYVIDSWKIYGSGWYARNDDMSIPVADYNNDIPVQSVTLTDRYGNALSNQVAQGNNGAMEYFTLNDNYKVLNRVGSSIQIEMNGESVWLKVAYVK